MTEMIVKESITEQQASQLSPLALAFVGDSVFDLYVRTGLVLQNRGNTGVLHAMSSGIVNAKAQAQFAHTIEPHLHEKEHYIFMRGRNAKSATVPKNMSVADYRYATAAETLIGFLYLTGQMQRIHELFQNLEFPPSHKDRAKREQDNT